MQYLIPLTSVLVVLAGPIDVSPAQDPNAIQGCSIVAFQRVPVASFEAGMLKSIEVNEGEDVEENQLVARIHDEELVWGAKVAQYQYESKKMQAHNTLALEVYSLAEEVAKAELDAAEAADKKVPDSVSEFELRQLLAKHQRSEKQKQLEQFNLELAEMDMRAAAAQYQQAEVMVERRQLKAPHNGRVEKVVRYKGDWVTPGEPVIHLTRMDRLRVEGRVSATRFHPGDIDRRKADVHVAVAGREPGKTLTLQGVEVIASYVVEADGSFRIMAEVENRKQGQRWLLNPGMSATVVLQGQ